MHYLESFWFSSRLDGRCVQRGGGEAGCFAFVCFFCYLGAVGVLRHLRIVLYVGLQCIIAIFPDHTYFLNF